MNKLRWDDLLVEFTFGWFRALGCKLMGHDWSRWQYTRYGDEHNARRSCWRCGHNEHR